MTTSKTVFCGLDPESGERVSLTLIAGTPGGVLRVNHNPRPGTTRAVSSVRLDSACAARAVLAILSWNQACRYAPPN